MLCLPHAQLCAHHTCSWNWLTTRSPSRRTAGSKQHGVPRVRNRRWPTWRRLSADSHNPTVASSIGVNSKPMLSCGARCRGQDSGTCISHPDLGQCAHGLAALNFTEPTYAAAVDPSEHYYVVSNQASAHRS